MTASFELNSSALLASTSSERASLNELSVNRGMSETMLWGTVITLRARASRRRKLIQDLIALREQMRARLSLNQENVNNPSTDENDLQRLQNQVNSLRFLSGSLDSKIAEQQRIISTEESMADDLDAAAEKIGDTSRNLEQREEFFAAVNRFVHQSANNDDRAGERMLSTFAGLRNDLRDQASDVLDDISNRSTGALMDACPADGSIADGSFRADGSANALCRDSIDQAPSAAAARAILWTFQHLGIPYGRGDGPATGGCSVISSRIGPGSFDCSGFVTSAYTQTGTDVTAAGNPNPNTAQMLGAWAHGSGINPAQARPGDLLFPTQGHVALVLSNGNVIQTNSCGDVSHVTTTADVAGDYMRYFRINP